MYKKLINILLCCLLSLCLTSCGEKEEREKDDKLNDSSKNEKINLNDNIYYYEDVQLTGKNCGGFGFPSNAESILDESWISSYGDFKAVDKMELLMHDGIIYDEEKENATKEEWEKLEKPSRGIKEFSLGYNNHEFYFGYWYIVLVKDEEGTEFSSTDKYYELSQNLNSEINSFNKKAYSIIQDKDGYRFQGTCGGPSYQMLLLDENICSTYNLNCDRW